MDRPSALTRLAKLSAGLAPTAATTAAELQIARGALARSLLQHAQDPTEAVTSLPVAPMSAPAPAEFAEFGRLLDEAEAAAAGPVPLVVRRSLPAAIFGNPALVPAAIAGMLPQSIGPFVDQLGLLHWFDLFSPVQQTAITRVPAATPFLRLPLALPVGPMPTTLPVSAGSLWIAAQLLAPAAPVGGYVGIRISGGTVTFSAAPTVAAGGLQIAGTTTVTLTVQPDSPAGPLGGGAPGADGGAVVAAMPAEVTFVFTQAGASITAAGDTSLTVYGSAVALHWHPAAPVYEAALAQILIPLQPQATSFAAGSVLSALLRPAGTARITGGAWALPVTVAAPAQLGTAATAGLLALVLGPGLRVDWPGFAGGPAGLQSVFLLGAGGMLALLAAIRSTNRFGGEIDLWRDTPASTTARSTIDLTFPKDALIYYTSIASFAGSNHVEIVACGALITAHIDRPLAADGGRLGPTLPGALTLYETTTLKEALIVGQAPQAPAPPPPIALALHNALLVTTPPTLLLAAGSFTVTPAQLDTGGLLLSFGLETLLPTLPDPYAANFLPGRQAPNATAAPSSAVLATILWSPTAATQLHFSDVALTPLSWHVMPLPATPAPEKQRDEFLRLFDDSLSSANPTLFLLDVSSNADQLGVGMAIAPGTVAPAPTGQALSISGLDLMAPCLDLRVFTAPAVQWEPVVTIQNPNVLPFPFPSPAGFLDDGGPTLLGAADITLVPVAPAPLLDQVVSAYDGGAAGAALFTLPFGMIAVATLPQRPAHPSPLFRRPGLAEVQPAFTPQNMTGGRQVSLTAPASLVQIGGRTPALPGAAVQLRNLVDQGGNPVKDQNGAQLSVLGPEVDQAFNSEFGPGSNTALVPVTRIDLSGYGASSFSAWADPAANADAVVQVRFNLMVGRASHEVVQVKSILASGVGFAVVVRTVTIDRQDGSEIYRYDSGWVAATPATWTLVPALTVHPGAVLGAQNIREIRDTSQTFKNAGMELTAVYFDADIQIDGVISGASGGLVPSTGQLGFVLTAPPNTALQASDLAALIASQGPLGGPLDCVIAVAGTAQTMRLSRVEMANAPHAGAAVPQEFAAAARGSLVLPAQGSWSVLARTDTASEPTPIDADRGVPLIRQSPAAGPPGNAPWRLAEQADLWVPDTPAMDYCLLHATDSTRVLFPRPKIESGTTAFTSTQTPLLADGFALMEATGICPRQDACLAFPDANYSLQISGAGAFTLTGVPDPFAPSLGGRTLASGTAAAIGFEYADETGNPSQVSVAIQPNSWSVGLRGVNVRLDIAPFNGLMRTVGDVQAATDGVNFADARLVLGSVLLPLQLMITFLEALGLPDPLALSFSNSGWTRTKMYKLSAGLGFHLPMKKPINIPTNTPIGDFEIDLTLGFGNAPSSSVSAFSGSGQWAAYLDFQGSLQVPVLPPSPIPKAGGLVGFKMEAAFPAGSAPAKEQFSLQLGVVISVKGDLGPILELEAEAAFAFMLVVITTPPPTSVGIGVALILEASGKILDGLVGIKFTTEFDGLVFVTPSPIKVQATFDIQVDVTVAWFVDVDFEQQVQYTKALS